MRGTYLPGAVFMAQVGPFHQDLPAGAAGGAAAGQEALRHRPGPVHAVARLLVPPLEVDALALGYAQQQALGHPLVVDVRLAHVLDQVLRLALSFCSVQLVGHYTRSEGSSGLRVKVLRLFLYIELANDRTETCHQYLKQWLLSWMLVRASAITT